MENLEQKSDTDLTLMLNHEMVIGLINSALSQQIVAEKARRYAVQRTSTKPE